MLEGKKITAIVLAAGKGKRMGTAMSKQYLELKNHPVLFYSIDAFEKSIVDEIILVVSADKIEFCINEIIKKYNFQKVKQVVAGGKERYDSVYQGLCAIEETDVVMVHDGARAFVSPEIIKKVANQSLAYPACIVGVPVKDTIKQAGVDNNVVQTLNRNVLWQIQTPQSFSYDALKKAYKYVLEQNISGITDDAMIWEQYFDIPVHIVEGDYFNIKITTPEDLVFGEAILEIKDR